MNEAAKEARRAYQRKWCRENREKVKHYQETYWMRKAEAAAREAGSEAGGDPEHDSKATGEEA